AAVCEEKVLGADVYVGIYGRRYGSLVRDRPETSYTELEFECATRAGLPRLVFVIDTESPDHSLLPVPHDSRDIDRQSMFLARVRANLTIQTFCNVDELRRLIEHALRDLERRFVAPAVMPAPADQPADIGFSVPPLTRGLVERPELHGQIIARL